MIVAVALLLLQAGAAVDFSVIEEAHTAFLDSSFVAERHFTVSLNGELKLREITQLAYSDHLLSMDVIEREVLDSKLVLEEGEGEPILDLPLECDRIEVADGEVKLDSVDGTETVVFAFDPEAVALRPLRWVNRESTRFLFKKLEIEATAIPKAIARQYGVEPGDQIEFQP